MPRRYATSSIAFTRLALTYTRCGANAVHPAPGVHQRPRVGGSPRAQPALDRAHAAHRREASRQRVAAHPAAAARAHPHGHLGQAAGEDPHGSHAAVGGRVERPAVAVAGALVADHAVAAGREPAVHPKARPPHALGDDEPAADGPHAHVRHRPLPVDPARAVDRLAQVERPGCRVGRRGQSHERSHDGYRVPEAHRQGMVRVPVSTARRRSPSLDGIRRLLHSIIDAAHVRAHRLSAARASARRRRVHAPRNRDLVRLRYRDHADRHPGADRDGVGLALARRARARPVRARSWEWRSRAPTGPIPWGRAGGGAWPPGWPTPPPGRTSPSSCSSSRSGSSRSPSRPSVLGVGVRRAVCAGVLLGAAGRRVGRGHRPGHGVGGDRRSSRSARSCCCSVFRD